MDVINLSKVKHYNSLVVLDIDKLSLETIDNVKTICISDVHTFACFKSPSNRGLKVIVKSDSNLQNHTNTFNEIKNYYETLIGIGVDPSGSNFNRLCFYSYDPDIYVHLDSQIFISKVNMITNDVSKIVELIVANQTDITNDYKDWLTVGFALADYCGESGREFYHRISSINSQYDYSECNNQYNNCLKSKGTGITIKSLFYLAKSNGIDISSIRSFSLNDIVKESVNAQSKSIKPEKIKSNILEIAEGYLNNKYDFRYNIVLGKLEYKLKGAGTYSLMTDFHENSIFRQLHKNNIFIGMDKLRSVLQFYFCKVYDPFLDYFNSLQAWDEVTDYVDNLANTVLTTNQPLWRACFKIWFVAVVASVLDPKVVNHTSIIFSGGQGIGKTTWMENLCPPQLRSYMFSGTINPNNKDTLAHLSECIFINMDELENMNKTEIGTLKQIITQANIRLRKAYGRYNESLVRRASFMGSVNTNQFLNDTTGSRRFLCFEVLDIDYNHNIDIHNVFAQGLYLWKSGFRYYFTKEDIEVINANNEQYQISTAEEELLLAYYEQAEPAKADLFLTASQIMASLSAKGNTHATNGNVISLGKALKKHGFSRVKRKGIYTWAVKELSIDEINNRQTNKTWDDVF